MNPNTVDLKFIVLVTVICVFANVGCTGTGESPGNIRLQNNPESSSTKGTPSPEVGSQPAPKDAGDIKRGNSPPGTDRAGGDPSSGAIVDPAGVLTK
jgi:hypothetical protein